jgi:hypothetical protein
MAQSEAISHSTLRERLTLNAPKREYWNRYCTRATICCHKRYCPQSRLHREWYSLSVLTYRHIVIGGGKYIINLLLFDLIAPPPPPSLASFLWTFLPPVSSICPPLLTRAHNFNLPLCRTPSNARPARFPRRLRAVNVLHSASGSEDEPTAYAPQMRNRTNKGTRREWPTQGLVLALVLA